VVGVYGVKGWIKLESDTRPREAIFNYSPWRLGLKNGWEQRVVRHGETRGNGLVARLDGIDDRDTAYSLIGTPIAIPRQELPGVAPGEFYWADLVGCRVVNQDGVEFGRIAGLMETGANDVLVVEGTRERLIPYIDKVIVSVDLAQQLVKVDWEEDF
jgi:16S rRNA processing protein RimM